MVSTSSVKDCSPYWTDWHEEQSSRLWLPTRTALPALVSNSSPTCSSKTVANSWFSIELNTAPSESYPTIFSPSFTSSLAECTGCDDTLLKSKKIRLYPTRQQESIFRQWFGTARVAFNAAVSFLKTPGTKANWKSIKTGLLRGLPAWSEETPYQIRSVAVRDACKAVSAAKRRFKEGGGFQDVGFRSRKNPVQSCYIPKSALRNGGVYPTLSRGALRMVEEVPKEHCDLRLVCERGRWFLIVPVQQKRCVAENQGRVVALDPGIRSFQTFYTESSCGKLGAGDFGKIQRLCSHMDDLISRRRLETHRLRKRNLRRAIVSMQVRIRNLVDDLHHKVAAFLVKSFDVIVLPTFETSEMVRRGARRLRAKSVRSMLTFSHYRFKTFLKHKAFEYGKLVLDQNEAWTSKTVSWTGEINAKLGGAKTVRSASTGVSMDRDYNGARGIFLRALGDQPILRGNLLDASALGVALATSGSEK